MACLMVFLDVVYNHFGPDGNYIGRYASGFRDDRASPWGQMIDSDARRCAAISSTTR